MFTALLRTSRTPARLAFLALASVSFAALTGCPSDQQTTRAAAPGTVPANATAPPSQAKTQGSALPAPQTPDTRAAAAQGQQLIVNAEQAYKSGVENYRNNRLDAARQDFDYAVDLMLSSGQALKGEGPVPEEFERLVGAINSLELAALKQGNGLTPKQEESPLDAASNLTFAADPALTARLRAELNTTSDLPLVINDQVAGYINAFANSPSFRAHMLRSLQRAGKYKTMIQRILKEEGVPQDLIYLAVAESGFQPQAINTRGSGAGGMWQFMPTNAYGLARNGYFDERFDPEKSTRAYARYIKKVYAQLGDWYLAMAGYDWGPGNIQRVVMRTGYADFWELYRRNVMPAETRNYVPQILAAIIMAKNPEKYGLDKMTPDKPVIYDTVSTNYGIDLHLVADVTDSSVAEIAALNPSLLRMSTPRDLSFDLHLPAGTKQLFQDRLKDIPEDRRATWRFHTVRLGESVESIASSLHARSSDITETNGITAADPISPGDELVVPVQSVAARPLRYTLRRGDTLVAVADRFNISVEDLRQWNGRSASISRPGRTLYVAEPVRLGPSSRARGRGRHAARGRSTRSGRGSTHLSRSVSRSASRSVSRSASRRTTRLSAHTAHASAAHSGAAKKRRR